MSVKKLDFNSIIAMYEKEGNTKKVEKFIILALDILALDNYSPSDSEESDEINEKYSFLEGRYLDSNIIERYKDIEDVLYFLAEKRVKPEEFVWELVSNKCSYYQVKELVKQGIIPIKYLEDNVIKSRDISSYFDILNNDTLENVNYDLIITNLLGLEEYFNSLEYLNCIPSILIKRPFNEAFHIELAQKLCKSESIFRFSRIEEIITYFFKGHPNDFENFLSTRPDILVLFKYLISRKKDFSNNIIDICKEKEARIIEAIKEGTINNFAWHVDLYQIGINDRIDILNTWARNNQVLVFDIYYEYFSNNNPDYENVGKELDEKFQKLNAEEHEQPFMRVRDKKDNNPDNN